MDKRIIVALVVISVSALGVAYFAPRRIALAAAPERTPDDSAAALGALRSEVSALRQELRNNASGVSVLRAQTGDLSAAVAAASAQAEQASAKEPTGPDPRLARDSPERAAWEADRQAMIATTEADFQAEARDGTWASGTTSSIREAASKHGTLGDALSAVDCRSKTCRVEIPDGPNNTQDLSRFLTDCGSIFPKFVSNHVVGADGKPSYVLYMMSGS
ncbi:MAG: hypothetical protein ABW061_07200 [Polyangiaceae bacterium]